MEQLKYKTVIAAPAKKVWETMLEEETYKQWVAKSWPNSFYEGSWKQGEQIKFTGPEGGGTLALLEEVTPYKKIYARHIALLGPGGEEDRNSDMAKSWVGSIEAYSFEEKDGKTTVLVTIETTPAWKQMFDDGWPTALEELKNIAEDKVAVAR